MLFLFSLPLLSCACCSKIRDSFWTVTYRPKLVLDIKLSENERHSLQYAGEARHNKQATTDKFRLLFPSGRETVLWRVIMLTHNHPECFQIALFINYFWTFLKSLLKKPYAEIPKKLSYTTFSLFGSTLHTPEHKNRMQRGLLSRLLV